MRESDSSQREFGDLLWLVVPILLFLLFALAVSSNTKAGGDYPGDFVVFHGAGSLFADGSYSTAYDFDAFSVYLNSEYDRPLSDGNLAHFLNPPPFGWFAQVLSVLPIGSSFAAWSVVGLALTIGSCVWLGLPKKALLLVLLSPMLTANLSFGQTGAAALVVTVAIHHFLIHDRRIAAGLMAGVFILKPPLAIGYGLFWLIKWRTHIPAIGVALASGAVLSLPMLPAGLDPWRDFIATTLERTSLDDRISAGSSFSLAEFVKQFLIGAPSTVTVAIWLGGFAVGVAMLVAVDRRTGGDVELLSATAAMVTVLFSPHILMYDSLIVLIPIAVGYRYGALNGRRVGILTLITGFGVSSRLLLGGPSLEFPAMMLATVLLALWIDKARENPANLVPVLTDSGAIDREGEHLLIGE